MRCPCLCQCAVGASAAGWAAPASVSLPASLRPVLVLQRVRPGWGVRRLGMPHRRARWRLLLARLTASGGHLLTLLVARQIAHMLLNVRQDGLKDLRCILGYSCAAPVVVKETLEPTFLCDVRILIRGRVVVAREA